MTTSHWFQWKVNCVQLCCQKCQLRSHWSMVLAAALGHSSSTHSLYDLCRDSLQINSFHSFFFFFYFQGVSVDIHSHSQPLLCSSSFILHLNNFTAWIWPVLQLKGKAKQCLHFGERLEPLAVNFSFGVSPQGPFTLYFSSDKTTLLFIKNNGALIILIKKNNGAGVMMTKYNSHVFPRAWAEWGGARHWSLPDPSTDIGICHTWGPRQSSFLQRPRAESTVSSRVITFPRQ